MSDMARVAIVGSREWENPEVVRLYVAGLDPGDEVVSGGCPDSPDQWAEDAARSIGLAVKVFAPDMTGVRSYSDSVKRYYARNQQIADYCDRMVAFVSKTRQGGTEDAIKRADKAGKKVDIILPSSATTDRPRKDPK
jgi:hypothetical protein